MKKLSHPIFFTLLSLCLVLSACTKDEPTSEDYFIEENLFHCAALESAKLVADDENIDELLEALGYYFLDMFDHLRVLDVSDGTRSRDFSISANEMVRYAFHVVICADDGIYAFDDQLNIRQVWDMKCRSMSISPDNRIIFAGNDHMSKHADRIYELYLSQNEVIPITDRNQIGSCISLLELAVGGKQPHLGRKL